MSAETDIFAILSATSPVTDIVSSRIYPDAIPEKQPLPAVVMSRNGGERFFGLDNSIHAERVRMRIVCWADTRGVADQVSAAIGAALLAAGYQPEIEDAAIDAEVGSYAGIVETDWWSE